MTVSTVETYNIDVSELTNPSISTINITANVVVSTPLTLNLFRIGNGTHLNYVPLNSSYTGMFTFNGEMMTIHDNGQPIEFDLETFEVEVKSSTCTFTDHTLRTEA